MYVYRQMLTSYVFLDQFLLCWLGSSMQPAFPEDPPQPPTDDGSQKFSGYYVCSQV